MPAKMKVVSLGAMGLLLFAVRSVPIQAATRYALQSYREVVQEVIGRDGEIETYDRVLLDGKKGEFGLTDEEAEDIETEVRLEITSPLQKRIY
ncbi:MAG TPA: hypothetical protein VFM04_07920 [Candidatus Methylomirabilis sp.]|nr:hypothetical protein [Candidatus Methylomirabilis sp.]